MQVWPPPPPAGADEMRRRIEERQREIMQRQKPGTIAGFVGTSHYNPQTRSGSSNFNYWDGDTYVHETHRHHLGHELIAVERIRIDGQRLIYKHEVTGPGGKHDERETNFELEP